MSKDFIKIGLTGASGVLGQSIQRFTCLPSGEEIHWVPFEGDLLNTEDVARFVREFETFDGVYHFAAKVPVEKVEQKPLESFRVNVGSTVQLLEGVRFSRRKPWFFLASSSHVYQPSTSPLKEEDSTGSSNWYGMTKLQADLTAQFYQSRYGLPICIGRIFSFSHPLQKPPYFLPSVIQKIKNAPLGASLEIPGLLGTRDFSNADHITEVLLSLFQVRFVGLINVASGNQTLLLDVVNYLIQKLGRTDLSVIPLERGIMHLNADISRLKKQLVVPEFDLATFIDQIVMHA